MHPLSLAGNASEARDMSLVLLYQDSQEYGIQIKRHIGG